MNMTFLMAALVGISVFTSLTTQALKKILDEVGIKYSSNIMAVVVAIVLTIATSACYLVYTGTALTAQVVVEVVALTFLAFLVATVGYDKVVQAIKQIKDIIG